MVKWLDAGMVPSSSQSSGTTKPLAILSGLTGPMPGTVFS